MPGTRITCRRMLAGGRTSFLYLLCSPGALDLYPDKIHNKLIFSEKVPRGTYINILKVPENPPGAFQEIQDGVQDGRRRIVISRKLCKAVNFSSIFFCNIPFQLVLWSVHLHVVNSQTILMNI